MNGNVLTVGEFTEVLDKFGDVGTHIKFTHDGLKGVWLTGTVRGGSHKCESDGVMSMLVLIDSDYTVDLDDGWDAVEGYEDNLQMQRFYNILQEDFEVVKL